MTVMKIDTFEIPSFFFHGPATVEDIYINFMVYLQ